MKNHAVLALAFVLVLSACATMHRELVAPEITILSPSEGETVLLSSGSGVVPLTVAFNRFTKYTNIEVRWEAVDRRFALDRQINPRIDLVEFPINVPPGYEGPITVEVTTANGALGARDHITFKVIQERKRRRWFFPLP